jgi:outer membrane protein TolC
MLRLRVLIAVLIGVCGRGSEAQISNSTSDQTNNVLVVDLPSVLQLAGARNLDIEISREKLAEARANQESALWQFFPSVTPGVAYRRHDNLTQDVQGRILDVHKESYTLGPSVYLQLDLGDAIYKNLASRQLVKAADHGLESQQQDSTLSAALAYFDLAKAHFSTRVAEESIRISDEYAKQLDRAIGAGIAFKGDLFRAQVQVEKNRLTLRQTIEQRSVAMARLIQLLHLEPSLQLVTRDDELLALPIIPTNTVLSSALAQAVTTRPELAQSRHLLASARELKNGAKIGPLIPTIGAQAFAGGLGGGNDTVYNGLGSSQDYAVMLGWRIGPNGLFDRGRIRAAEARLKGAELADQKLIDEISRQVIESFVRWQSLADQISTSRAAQRAAEANLHLTRQRKEFGVGAVLEDINAEQELTRTRLEFVALIAEFNKAQFSLLKAIGSRTFDHGLSKTQTNEAR